MPYVRSAETETAHERMRKELVGRVHYGELQKWVSRLTWADVIAELGEEKVRSEMAIGAKILGNMGDKIETREDQTKYWADE